MPARSCCSGLKSSVTGDAEWTVIRCSPASAGEPQTLRRLPYAPMVVWHRRVGQAQMREGIVDRVREGRDAADIGRFADALGADRMMRRGRGRVIGLPYRRLDRGRQEKVEKAAV